MICIVNGEGVIAVVVADVDSFDLDVVMCSGSSWRTREQWLRWQRPELIWKGNKENGIEPWLYMTIGMFCESFLFLFNFQGS